MKEETKVKEITGRIFEIYEKVMSNVASQDDLIAFKKELQEKKGELEEIKANLEAELSKLYNAGSNTVDPEVNKLESKITEMGDYLENILPDLLNYIQPEQPEEMQKQFEENSLEEPTEVIEDFEEETIQETDEIEANEEVQAIEEDEIQEENAEPNEDLDVEEVKEEEPKELIDEDITEILNSNPSETAIRKAKSIVNYRRQMVTIENAIEKGQELASSLFQKLK